MKARKDGLDEISQIKELNNEEETPTKKESRNKTIDFYKK